MPLISGVIKTKTREEWIKILDAAGVPCGAISTVAEICENDILKARGMIWEMDHQTAGTIRSIANPIEFSDTVLSAPNPPPSLGEHVEDILIHTGYDSKAISNLRDKKII